jgi:hypothetical protein
MRLALLCSVLSVAIFACKTFKAHLHGSQVNDKTRLSVFSASPRAIALSPTCGAKPGRARGHPCQYAWNSDRSTSAWP